MSMKWFEHVKAFAMKIWADIEKYVRIAFAIIVVIVVFVLFSKSGTPKNEFEKKVDEAKKKNEEVKAKADEIVAKAKATSQEVTTSTNEIIKRKEDRDKEASQIFGGSK